ILLPCLTGPLRALWREIGVASSQPVLEALSLPLLVAGCLYQVFSHAHAGFLARYPQCIRTVRGFVIATVNDMSTQLLVYAWLGLLGARHAPLRAIILGGAAMHAFYLVLLVVVPRWFLYEASNLGAATLREEDGPGARARW